MPSSIRSFGLLYRHVRCFGLASKSSCKTSSRSSLSIVSVCDFLSFMVCLWFVYRFSAITVTIKSIDAMAMQAATMNALSSCFSVLTNWFCLCVFMVCLWFVLLIKDVKTYLASLFKRACPVWTAVVRVIVIRAARVIRRRSPFTIAKASLKRGCLFGFGKQLVNPSAIPTAKLLPL